MTPKISIIIPSYNQGKYLEETLDSILSQEYSALELIVIDGGSKDNSVKILKKYSKYIDYWTSEPDRGQTHAINKGLAKSTGEIWSYLNSDDLLRPGSLHQIAELFQNPELLWVGAVSEVFDDSGTRGYVKPQRPNHKRDYITPWNRSNQYVFPCSNVCFMRRELLDRCGYFDESYNYGMDIEYYIRVVFQTGIEPHLLPDILGRWRWHSESKTFKQGLAYGFREDEVRMALQYLPYIDAKEQKKLKKEIQVQELWLVTRRAMFYLEQGKLDKARAELFNQLKNHPDLLGFRPWYGAIKAMLYKTVSA